MGGVGAGGRRCGDTFVVVVVDAITINAGLAPTHSGESFSVCVWTLFTWINMLVVWFWIAGWLVRTGG